MKTGIIGLPQGQEIAVSHFDQSSSVGAGVLDPREAHIGVAKVPDDRLDV